MSDFNDLGDVGDFESFMKDPRLAEVVIWEW